MNEGMLDEGRAVDGSAEEDNLHWGHRTSQAESVLKGGRGVDFIWILELIIDAIFILACLWNGTYVPYA